MAQLMSRSMRMLVDDSIDRPRPRLLQRAQTRRPTPSTLSRPSPCPVHSLAVSLSPIRTTPTVRSSKHSSDFI